VRVPWKLLGVAGVAGVAATGVVVARKRRSHSEYTPDELRAKLHDRLAQSAGSATSETAPEPPDLSGPAHY
jgi:hypothetical protein